MHQALLHVIIRQFYSAAIIIEGKYYKMLHDSNVRFIQNFHRGEMMLNGRKRLSYDGTSSVFSYNIIINLW